MRSISLAAGFGLISIGIVWLLLDRLILRPIERRTTMRWGLLREGIENT